MLNHLFGILNDGKQVMGLFFHGIITHMWVIDAFTSSLKLEILLRIGRCTIFGIILQYWYNCFTQHCIHCICMLSYWFHQVLKRENMGYWIFCSAIWRVMRWKKLSRWYSHFNLVIKMGGNQLATHLLDAILCLSCLLFFDFIFHLLHSDLPLW